jgi:rare lipoprotein A
MSRRWLILILLAVIIGTTVVVVGQHAPLTQPQRSHIVRVPLPTRSGGPWDEAKAGSSGRSAQQAARDTQAGRGEPILQEDGSAAYYADKYQGRKTATGEQFDQNDLTAASRTLPLGARVTVVHRGNGKSVDVTINDRGPQVEGRILDLSKKAAEQLDMTQEGVAPVHVEARPSQQSTPELAEAVSQEALAQTDQGR